MASGDYQHATISELSEMVKSRKVSAEELGETFGASKETLKLAKQVDGDVKRERFRGPLQGIPFSTSGFRGNATAVTRLEKMGGLRVDSGAYSIGLGSAPGMTSLQATYGLISRHGMSPCAWTMDSVTISCRTAEDCGLVLQGIAGGDKEDPGSVQKSFYYTPQYARAFKDLRIGFVPPAVSILSGLGVTVVDVKAPEYPYSVIADTILACEGASAYEPQIKSGQIDQLVDARQAALFRAGLTIPAKDYLKAQRIRSVLQKDFRKLFSELDALVLTDETPAKLAGLPMISLPSGASNVLLAGPIFTENTLIALGKAFQMQAS